MTSVLHPGCLQGALAPLPVPRARPPALPLKWEPSSLHRPALLCAELLSGQPFLSKPGLGEGFRSIGLPSTPVRLPQGLGSL